MFLSTFRIFVHLYTMPNKISNMIFISRGQTDKNKNAELKATDGKLKFLRGSTDAWQCLRCQSFRGGTGKKKTKYRLHYYGTGLQRSMNEWTIQFQYTRVLAPISWTGLNEITESDALEKGCTSYPVARLLSLDVLYFIVHFRFSSGPCKRKHKNRRGI